MTLRIPNRLFEITEDAPPVHFCTECAWIGRGLEEQLNLFLTEHPDTVLVVIDTLQMIRGSGYDNTYANDYRDLSALKRIADKSGIAILLIHHLCKEPAEDVFSRISGTMAISGAVDTSLALIEDKCGSGRAVLSCVGRDIEYRELTLERSAEQVWELRGDSREQPELLGDRIIFLISELLNVRPSFTGTPTELASLIDPDGREGITAKTVSRRTLQSLEALSACGITAVIRRSNGKRLIELHRAGRADMAGGEETALSTLWNTARRCGMRGWTAQNVRDAAEIRRWTEGTIFMLDKGGWPLCGPPPGNTAPQRGSETSLRWPFLGRPGCVGWPEWTKHPPNTAWLPTLTRWRSQVTMKEWRKMG